MLKAKDSTKNLIIEFIRLCDKDIGSLLQHTDNVNNKFVFTFCELIPNLHYYVDEDGNYLKDEDYYVTVKVVISDERVIILRSLDLDTTTLTYAPFSITYSANTSCVTAEQLHVATCSALLIRNP